MFRSIMRRAVTEGIITVNPCDKVKGISNVKLEKAVLTADEVKRLFDTECRERTETKVKCAFLFACNTGLRYSDIRSLTWGDLEQQGGQWTLHMDCPVGQSTSWRKPRGQVKTGGTVNGILNDTAVSLIDANDMIIHFPDDFVFEELSSMKSSSLTNTTIKQWAKAAGINKCVSWHTARRTPLA